MDLRLKHLTMVGNCSIIDLKRIFPIFFICQSATGTQRCLGHWIKDAKIINFLIGVFILTIFNTISLFNCAVQFWVQLRHANSGVVVGWVHSYSVHLSLMGDYVPWNVFTASWSWGLIWSWARSGLLESWPVALVQFHCRPTVPAVFFLQREWSFFRSIYQDLMTTLYNFFHLHICP